MLSKRLARRRAFTLLEVMIVTGIMMSQANNYGDVKRLAYQKSCENNLRQLYMATQYYAQDRDDQPVLRTVRGLFAREDAPQRKHFDADVSQ